MDLRESLFLKKQLFLRTEDVVQCGSLSSIPSTTNYERKRGKKEGKKEGKEKKQKMQEKRA